eukprot:1180054-Prorocentrum_minimum.AAC.2
MPPRHSTHRPQRLTAWAVRGGIIVVVIFNVACAMYVGSYMQNANTRQFKRYVRQGFARAPVRYNGQQSKYQNCSQLDWLVHVSVCLVGKEHGMLLMVHFGQCHAICKRLSSLMLWMSTRDNVCPSERKC